ncbi:MAG: restriction endonuclease subunit S [Eubacteriales bacterium]|nr:restriction endonuclease subunit S [Eubacteriales bacterium]
MTLQEICELIVDCPHSTAKDEGNGYPLIRTPNIGKGRLILEGVHRVSKDTYDKRNARAIPKENDIIFAREAPAGNAALIRSGQEVCLGQRTVLIRPDSQKVSPEFLVYYLLAPQQQYELLGTANGATVAHVNIPVIRNLTVDLPDRDTQDKIANILSSYDDLIENNQKQIKLLEEAAQRLYKEWFVDLRFPESEDVEIIDGVPEGWKTSTLGSVCKLRKESLKPEQIPSGLPYIGLEHIPRKDICLSTWGDSSDVNSSKYKYQEKDILFGKIRPYFHKVGFALNSGITSTDTIVILPQEALWGYILMTVSSEAFVNYTYQNCKEGAKMPRADWKQMQQYSILIPPSEIGNEFEKFLHMVTDRIKNLAFQNIKLTEARDRLLPKLMSGEIEV